MITTSHFFASILLVLTLPLASVSNGLESQPRHTPTFYVGTVMPITSIRLWGELSFQPDTQTLLFRKNGQWRTYRAEQVRQFNYSDGRRLHYFVTYDIPQSSGETRSVVLESLIPGAQVALLQLPEPKSIRWATKQGLPYTDAVQWRTEQPWYVDIDGRLIAPDVFVQNELNALLAHAPQSVRQWATGIPRPKNPKALARWLAVFEGEMKRTQPRSKTESPFKNDFVYPDPLAKT